MKINFYIVGGVFIILCLIVIVILYTMNSNKDACIVAKKRRCMQEPDYIEVPEIERPTIRIIDSK